MVRGMVKLEEWLWVKAGPCWCAYVAVKVSQVGAAECDDVLASRAAEEWHRVRQ